MKCPTCNGSGECDEPKVVVNNMSINIDGDINHVASEVVRRLNRQRAVMAYNNKYWPPISKHWKEADVPDVNDCAVVYDSAH